MSPAGPLALSDEQAEAFARKEPIAIEEELEAERAPVEVLSTKPVRNHPFLPIVFLLTVAAGVLMVSNVRYQSFKDLNFGERVPFRYILIMLIVFVLIILDPPRVLFLAFFVYAASGPFMAVRRWKLKRGQG